MDSKYDYSVLKEGIIPAEEDNLEAYGRYRRMKVVFTGLNTLLNG